LPKQTVVYKQRAQVIWANLNYLTIKRLFM